MVSLPYIPDRGDIVHISFEPTRGREQKGRRPALVLTSKYYNERVELLVACPITSHIKGYPFEVSITLHGKQNAVLCDQIRTLDWTKRSVSYFDTASTLVIEQVVQKISILLGRLY